MEINKVIGDILGVVCTEDIVEGRMICLTSHSQDVDYGSQTDLPGAKLPTSAEEANRARFVITWQQDNRKPPYFNPMPSYSFALRNMFGSAANVPFSATVWLTYPGFQNSVTIPSGTAAVAFGAGTYTVPSGQYIYSASLVPGAPLSVSYSGTDKGKLQYLATWGVSAVGEVYRRDSSTGDLTFVIKEF